MVFSAFTQKIVASTNHYFDGFARHLADSCKRINYCAFHLYLVLKDEYFRFLCVLPRLSRLFSD